MKLDGLLSPAQRRVLTGLHERDAGERREGDRSAGSILAVAAPVAEFLHLLVVQTQAQRIAEFGTSHGYSTIHLAAAAQRTGGHVYSVDALADKTARARDNLRDAGLLHRVSLTTADGAEFVHGLPAQVDFVLVDYDVAAFLPAFAALRERMAGGCTMFVDGGPDGYWDTGGGGALKALLDEDPELLVCVLPMHKQQLVAVRV